MYYRYDWEKYFLQNMYAWEIQFYVDLPIRVSFDRLTYINCTLVWLKSTFFIYVYLSYHRKCSSKFLILRLQYNTWQTLSDVLHQVINFSNVTCDNRHPFQHFPNNTDKEIPTTKFKVYNIGSKFDDRNTSWDGGRTRIPHWNNLISSMIFLSLKIPNVWIIS